MHACMCTCIATEQSAVTLNSLTRCSIPQLEPSISLGNPRVLNPCLQGQLCRICRQGFGPRPNPLRTFGDSFRPAGLVPLSYSLPFRLLCSVVVFPRGFLPKTFLFKKIFFLAKVSRDNWNFMLCSWLHVRLAQAPHACV